MRLSGLGLLAATVTSAVTAQPRTPPPLPAAVANNAVAAGSSNGRLTIYSVLGIDSTKRWSGIVKRAFRWTEGHSAWEELPSVPGTVGRLAATAQIVRGRVFLFGGYTVAPTGAERSVPEVDIFDPRTRGWSQGAPIPVPVDDAVSAVYRDSLVYLVSGWHDTANVALVQIYDAALNQWSEGTAFPGTPVFGHAGALVAGTLIIIDGAKRVPEPFRYAMERQAWQGRINSNDPTRIAWSRLLDHPGAPRYRAAAAACGATVVIVGGSANPYNYDGVGYNRAPSLPEPGGVEYDPDNRRWRVLPAAAEATMDHRALVVVGRQGWAVGGMRSSQRVSGSTVPYSLPGC